MLRSVLWAVYIHQSHRKAKAECLRKSPSESIDFYQQETSTLVKQMPRQGGLKGYGYRQEIVQCFRDVMSIQNWERPGIR